MIIYKSDSSIFTVHAHDNGTDITRADIEFMIDNLKTRLKYYDIFDGDDVLVLLPKSKDSLAFDWYLDIDEFEENAPELKNGSCVWIHINNSFVEKFFEDIMSCVSDDVHDDDFMESNYDDLYDHARRDEWFIERNRISIALEDWHKTLHVDQYTIDMFQEQMC